MDAETYIAAVNEVNSLAAQGRYDEALRSVNQLIKTCPCVELLIHRGRLIQLSSASELPLEEALNSFATALRIQPNSVEALMERSWFDYSVQDNPSEALCGFQSVIDLSGRMLWQALVGKAKCYYEMGDTAAATRVVKVAEILTQTLGLNVEDWPLPMDPSEHP